MTQPGLQEPDPARGPVPAAPETTSLPDPVPSEQPRRRRHRLSGAAVIVCWLYLAGLVAVWLLLLLGADRRPVGTVAMYGPRWLWSLPLIVLVPLAVLLRHRSFLLPLALSVVVLLWPVMRLCLPWERALPHHDGISRVRVATLNCDIGDLRPDAFREWLNRTNPRVLALQAVASAHPQKIFGADPLTLGWHIHRDGELLLASRYPIIASRFASDDSFSGGNGGTLAAYDLQGPDGVIHVFNVHTATPRFALLSVIHRGWDGLGQVEKNIERRRRQSELARQWVDEAGKSGGRVIVLGDFNMPADSAIYRQYWSDFSNAFSAAGLGFGSTHFTHRTAVRIDHVLAGPGWRFRRAWVGPFLGSAHRPVVADVDATAAASNQH